MPETKPTIEQLMDAFLNRLIAEKGLDPHTEVDLRASLREELNERIDLAMLAALPDDKLDELERLAEQDPSDEELDAFFDSCGDTAFDDAVRVTMREFWQEQLAEEGDK